jgi:NAD(P)H-hydrate repair Nnr-like enzyme with NAD(P)H-hydrate dehydratase domain
VAQSSYEAGYIAAVTAACQGVWLRRLLGDLMNKEEERVVLNIDNKSAIHYAKIRFIMTGVSTLI